MNYTFGLSVRRSALLFTLFAVPFGVGAADGSVATTKCYINGSAIGAAFSESKIRAPQMDVLFWHGIYMIWKNTC